VLSTRRRPGRRPSSNGLFYTETLGIDRTRLNECFAVVGERLPSKCGSGLRSPQGYQTARPIYSWKCLATRGQSNRARCIVFRRAGQCAPWNLQMTVRWYYLAIPMGQKEQQNFLFSEQPTHSRWSFGHSTLGSAVASAIWSLWSVLRFERSANKHYSVAMTGL